MTGSSAVARAAAARRAQVLTVPEVLAARAARQPEHVAISQGTQSLTMAAWQTRTGAVAAGLARAGVRPGDRVALCYGGRDWIDYAIAYTATLAAGAVAVPVSARSAPPELAYVLEHSGATVLCHGAGEAPDSAGRLRLDPAALAELAGGPAAELPSVRPNDSAQILYTSGTTGRPKGVLASHANVTWGCRTDPPLRRLAHSTLFLHAFPIGTNAAQTMLVNALDAHPGMLATARFVPNHFARLIAEHRVGSVFLVPAMATELLHSGAIQGHDLTSLRLLGSTAAALPPATAAGLARLLPDATLVNYYTSTEAAPAQTTMVFDPAHPDALGRPANSGDLRVLDPTGTPCPAGVTGEVWLRSPTTPRTYHGDPAASATVFRDGWIRMGDLGYFTDDGLLYLVDRESDVIKSGADKVSTVAVESALHEHPDIRDVAVLGLPHPVLGATPVAAVVATRPVSLAELRPFLASRLATHQHPTRLLVLESLPRNAGGKVLKARLRELFATSEGTP